MSKDWNDKDQDAPNDTAHSAPSAGKMKPIVLVVLAVIFVLAAGFLAYYFTTLKANTEIYENLQETVVATQSPTPTDAATQTPDATETPAEIPIDFEALYEINPDVYAWIEIADTEVSYPILRHPSDDSYYLDYTIDHVNGLPGSIYTESVDALDFSDFNTVIYGHNMANDTMFGSLNNYRDLNYFEEHNEIIIYTETEARVYQIFAAVVYDNRYIPYTYDDTSPAACEAFLDSIYNNRNINDIIDESVTVTADSQLITLSTCIGNMPNNRYLVVAVYVEE